MNSPQTNKLFLLILWMLVILPQSVVAETAKPIELPVSQPVVPALPSSIKESEKSTSGSNMSSEPVWKNLKTEDLSLPNHKKNDEGFVKPPPSKQKILIRASATSVARGDSITFSLDNVDENVRYFWLIDQQKSTASEFVVDTSALNPGQHRVRVTITDKDKNQKHSAAFFTVEKREFDENASAEADESKEQSTEPPQETSEPSNAADDAEHATVRIEPAILRVKPGEVATFVSSKNAIDGFEYQWAFQDTRSREEQFEISTGGVAPGTYSVDLELKSADGQISTATASLVILSPDEQSKTMPDLRGITIDALEQQLVENNLLKGTITTQPANDKMGIVIAHTPASGERIEEGGVVNFTIGVAADAMVPSLLGLTRGGAKEAIEKAGFTVGTITEKPVENQIGLVVEQQPKSGVSINKGASVDMSIGVATEEPISITIDPKATAITQGDELRYLFNETISGEYVVKWKVDDQEATGPAFIVDTQSLKAGEYTVTAEVFLGEKRVAQDSAKLVLNTKDRVMPYLTDLTLTEAQEKLASLGLKPTTIEKREAAITTPKVINSYPEFGEKVTPDTAITLKVVVPRNTSDISLVLTSDKSETRVGEAIILSSQLEGLEQKEDVHYVYKINHEKKANIRPELAWTPEAEGIYSIIATAFNDSGLIAESSPVSIRVGNAWEAPKAIITPEIISATSGERAEFVSTSTYDLNTTLKYSWNSETGHSGSKKQFSFDTTDVQPGTYQVTLSVMDGKGNIDETTSSLAVTEEEGEQRASESTDTPISNTPVLNQDNAITLSMESSKQFASTGDKVHFNVTANPPGNYRYFFSTQDAQDSGWIDSGQYMHTFSDFGTYRVVAALKNGEKVVYSNSVLVWVWSKSLITLVGGIGLSLVLLVVWWSRRSLQDKPAKKQEAASRTSPTVDTTIDDEAIKNDEELITEATTPIEGVDIHTESRPVDKNPVRSTLLRALIQFLLGLALSVVIIYIILKSI